jgi:hypothetical protein
MEGRVDGGGTAHVAHFATSPELGKSHPTGGSSARGLQ